jgi:hypothetical protein
MTMSRGSRRAIPLLAIVIALAIAIAGVFLDVRQIAAAFIAAYAAAVSVALAMLAMIMIAHLTTATWFGSFRRRAELVVGALPALAVLGVALLPLVIILDQRAGAAAAGPRHVYLNPTFLVLRTVLYWVSWLVTAEALRATTRLQARGETDRAARRFRIISCAGLVALGFTMTFAAFDWIMSLTPDWSSTMYGVYWFAGGAVGAVALLAVLARYDVGGPPPRVPIEDLHWLGKLVLTFIMFWIYIGFAQYIVIWSGNIPREVTWYVARTRGGWGFVALVLLLVSAAIPFLALLTLRVKRSFTILASLGGALLALHYVDTYWVVIPGIAPVTWWTLVLSAAALVIVVEPAVVVAAARSRTR